MRILLVTPGNGSHPHVFKAANFLAQRGHVVHLLTIAPPADGIGRRGLHSGIIVHAPLGAFHAKRMHRTIQRIRRLRRVIRDGEIEVVHAMFLGPNAWYAALAAPSPFVLSVMGNDLLPGQMPLGGGLGRLLSRFALRRADAITAWSRNLASLTEPYARKGVPVAVLHGGIDLQAFSRDESRARQLRAQLRIPDGAKVVLSPRVMQPRCNIDVIARAVPDIVRIVPESMFVFLRMRSSTPEYANEVERLLMTETPAQVRVVDEVVNHEMADFYSLATVTVSVASNDGTPMTVLESMACETPAVVAKITELDEHLFEDGRTVAMVPLRDRVALVEAVVRLIIDTEHRGRIVVGGRRVAEVYGAYDAEMEKLERVYLGALGRE